jgi:hypothetical protein
MNEAKFLGKIDQALEDYYKNKPGYGGGPLLFIAMMKLFLQQNSVKVTISRTRNGKSRPPRRPTSLNLVTPPTQQTSSGPVNPDTRVAVQQVVNNLQSWCTRRRKQRQPRYYFLLRKIFAAQRPTACRFAQADHNDMAICAKDLEQPGDKVSIDNY